MTSLVESRKVTSRARAIAGLSARIDAALAPMLPPGTRVALLGFPEYANVGDSLIWCGERAWLQRHGIECAYAAPFSRVNARELRRALGRDGIVLVTGGGFLTDTWPEMLGATMSLLTVLRDLPVILFPHSLHFADERVGHRFADAVAAHGRVTLLMRDDASEQRAQHLGICGVVQCPDFAFAAFAASEAKAERSTATSEPMRVVALRRRDCESAAQPVAEDPHLDGGVADRRWVSSRPGPRSLARLTLRAVWRCLAAVSTRAASSARAGQWLLDAQARLNVAGGHAVFDPADVVVTDRLHAVLAAFHRGCDVIAVDSGTGKVHDVLNTWLVDAERLDLVPTWSAAEALLAARLSE